MNPKQSWYNSIAPGVIDSFKKRHFVAYYCETRNAAAERILSLIPETDCVSWGGSATLAELGIPALLKEKGYTVIDRMDAKTPEEHDMLSRKALLCDTYLMSTNAFTADGQLFNIDGNGNRVSALIFGPKRVIIVAGMNKLCKNIDDAVRRVRNYAAPVNHQRFPGTAPCIKTGLCADCLSEDSICAQMVTTRLCRPAHRITVILIGDELGF